MEYTDHTAPVLTNADITELTAWRRNLHRYPELSGEEVETARNVRAMLEQTNPDFILTDLGGHGVAASFSGNEEGPTVMIRCELDALPIQELGTVGHRSQIPGKGHLCGHDGHMAIAMGVARWLGRHRPQRGRVVVMFQPAEEDGSGAEKVISDPRYHQIAPDYALALHNFPGVPLGHVVIDHGVVNCASRGMKITLTGRTAHASQPENGVSPAAAVARLIQSLSHLGTGGGAASPDFSLVTVTHATLGNPAFGVATGYAEIWVTLRTQTDDKMDALVAKAEHLVAQETIDGLATEVSYHDIFRHCENDPQATALIIEALKAQNVPYHAGQLPMRGSEDFGRFGDRAKAAMFLLGSGIDHPNLHNPDFDFPDDLIAAGVGIFAAALRTIAHNDASADVSGDR